MRNGVYSVHVTLGDGRTGKGSGVLVCRNGAMHGGDAFLFYVGSYQLRGDTICGEIVVNQHTRSPEGTPLFGGRQVGIGFTGHGKAGRIILDGTAFVGRESMLFHASMMFLSDLVEENEPGAEASGD